MFIIEFCPKTIAETTTQNYSIMNDEDDHNQLNNGKQSLKPFSSIPGPWPSLPLIGTGWYNFYCSLGMIIIVFIFYKKI